MSSTPVPEEAGLLGGAAAWRALEDGAAFVAGRDVVRVHGPEARSYLQGQCSQDVAGLAVGNAAWTLVLTPQGKVEALARVTATGDDELVLDVDGGAGPSLVARLQRFLLRTKVAIEPLDWRVVSVRRRRGPASDGDTPVELAAPLGGVVVPVTWPGWSGLDLMGPARPGAGERSWVRGSLPWVDPAVAEVGRIAAGVPRAGAEVTQRVIPAELGVLEQTVSFTKGCFTGQELVARLDARGNKVARHLLRLVIAASVADGLDVAALPGSTVVDGTSTEVGAVTSAGVVPGSGEVVALAFLHRRVEAPTDVSVLVEDDRGTRPLPATVRSLPL
ncbi:MAG: YgfZ/GcvT domain-containing protein [Acidimicrobiales bacterium]